MECNHDLMPISSNDTSAALWVCRKCQYQTYTPIESDVSSPLNDALETIREALSLTTQHATGYDWNADPLGLTLKQSEAFRLIDELKQAVIPSNPKPQAYEAAMRAYEGACLALNRALRDLGECL